MERLFLPRGATRPLTWGADVASWDREPATYWDAAQLQPMLLATTVVDTQASTSQDAGPRARIGAGSMLVLDAIRKAIEAKEDQDEFPLELRVSHKVLSRVKEEALLDTRKCYVKFNGYRVLWGLPIRVTDDPNCLVEVKC